MPTSPPQLEKLRLRKYLLVSALMLALLAGGAIFAFQEIRNDHDEKSQQRLDATAAEVTDHVREHLWHIVTDTVAIKSFLESRKGVTTKEEFHRYLSSFGLRKTFKGIRGIIFFGRATLTETRTGTVPLFVDDSEETEMTDQLTNSIIWLRQTVADAVDTGRQTVIVPLPPDNSAEVQFAVVAPVYDPDAATDSAENRRAALLGTLVLALNATTFLDEAASAAEIGSGAIFDVRSNDASGTPITLYSHGSNGCCLPSDRFLFSAPKATLTADVADAGWRLYFHASPGFGLSVYDRFAPLVVLLAGILVAALIASLFFVARTADQAKALKRENDILRDQHAFITVVSHQLRTPVSVIRWNIEAMLQEIKSTDLRELAKAIEQKIVSMGSIINNMLYFLEVSPRDILGQKRESVSLSQLVEVSTASTRKAASSKGIVLKFERPNFDDTVLAEPIGIARVVDFLIDNAITYNKSAGSVEVSIVLSSGRIVLKVKDTGFGIPAKEQTRIFEKFFRASNASLGKNEGSGVSLYLAKLIVESHGGTIGFQSREGEGSLFFISLPARRKVS